jgi:hypothetical protein
MAMWGWMIWKSLETMVQTPSKWPGREAPQRVWERAVSVTRMLVSGGYISAAVGWKMMSTPSAMQRARSAAKVRG